MSAPSLLTKYRHLLLACVALVLAACGGGDPGPDTTAAGARAHALTASGSTQSSAPVLSGQWTQLPNPNGSPPQGPGGRVWGGMTWDPSTQQVAIFGGNGPVQYQNDIWSYSRTTTNWTQIAPQVMCPGNYGFSGPNGTDDSDLRYDPVNNLFWVFGSPSGYRCLSYATVRTAAAGSNSTTVVDPNIPLAAAGAYVNWQVQSGSTTVMVTGYDPVQQTLTLASPIAGFGPGSSYLLFATTGAGVWYYDPAAQKWTGQNTPPGYLGPTPGARYAPGADLSPVANAFALYGGSATSADYSVWKLDLATKLWTQLPVPASGTPPNLREIGASFVYDQAHDVFILFGGKCAFDSTCPDQSVVGQTWAYSLATNTWTNMNPPSAPSARAEQVMAYDSVNKVVVMYGGQTADGTVQSDTWYYDYPSNTWTQVFPTTPPPARYLAQVAYDPVAQATVVFGGNINTGTTYGDIWSLDLHPSPSISITSPTAGATLTAPASVTLTASAGTPVSGATISQVSYYVNGTLVGSSSSAPYSVNWTNVLVGTYAVTAVATDSLGATGTSAPVSVSVGGSYVPPSVTVTGIGGSTSYTAPADIPLSVSATGGSGSIVQVAYYAGSTLLGTATASPWTFDWSDVAAGTYSITAVVTDSYGGVTTSPAVQVSVASAITNYALQSNGGVASASSTIGAGYSVASVNDGVRNGRQWGNGGGWNDATYATYPDWVQVSFSGTKTINQINVFTLTDNFANDPDPTPTTTFSLYGITAFNVQYWNGSSWVTVPGGAVTGNNLAWTTFSFPNLSTTAIRVQVNAALAGYSRITELEAWGPSSGAASSPPSVSLTSPANGSVYTAPASITLSASASGVSSPVSQVEFFSGSTSLGVATAAPYSLNWTNVDAGSYTITAVATDGLGNQAVSGSSTVMVNATTQGSVNVALQS
ncbi:MAG: hypothetical protein KGM91_15465, partial [Burkholderiales bacterium]|nr:hypothetical protein [Burkholderiales bacterium]